VRLRDTVLEQASLFPFFDPRGQVQALMLVWPAASDILILEYRPDLVRLRWWGRIEVRSELAALRNVDGHAATAFAGLWHYDPWWVLRAPRFASHSAVPVLKATNCAGRFRTPVLGCHFSRDLSRLEGVTVKSKTISGVGALERSYARFTPELLPRRREPAPPYPGRREWELNPFWLRSGWSLRS
jgi:hypothetical protein